MGFSFSKLIRNSYPPWETSNFFFFLSYQTYRTASVANLSPLRVKTRSPTGLIRRTKPYKF